MTSVFLAAVLASTVVQTPSPAAPAPTLRSVVQLPAPDPNAPPIVDIALRMVRAGTGGSSIARSAARGDEHSVLYYGLGPCVIGAAAEDPAHSPSLVWRASGRVRSVERGIAVADVEWQRVEYRQDGITAGPLVRTTLTLPLGERVAVDVVEPADSNCRADALIFEIGVAPDHGWRLSMSGEGRRESAGGGGRAGAGVGRVGAGGGGGAGSPAEYDARAERLRRSAEAALAAAVEKREMPPRAYSADVWLVPEAQASSPLPPLAQRLSQPIGGTGARFTFPPVSVVDPSGHGVVVDYSALLIPVAGERLIVAITRHVAPTDGTAAVSEGWLEAVPMPKPGAVLSFEIPAPATSDASIVPSQRYALRIRIDK